MHESEFASQPATNQYSVMVLARGGELPAHARNPVMGECLDKLRAVMDRSGWMSARLAQHHRNRTECSEVQFKRVART